MTAPILICIVFSGIVAFFWGLGNYLSSHAVTRDENEELLHPFASEDRFA